MSDMKSKAIWRSRKLLGDPYAYLDGEGGFSAAPANTRKQETYTPDRLELGNPYAYLNGDGKFDREPDVDAVSPRDSESSAKLNVLGRNFRGKPAEAARYLQEEIWRSRHKLWPDRVPEDPVDMLDPEIAIRCIGYEFILDEMLGQYRIGGVKSEVAGTIDQDQKVVRISRRLPFITRRFTTAHELGHALLHSQTGLHRDRPVDGSAATQRPKTEIEADKFASCFLMPEKLVRNRFARLFGKDKFVLDDAARFMLEAGGVKGFAEKMVSLRELSKALSSIRSYNGRHFDSLASQFHVSREAMAIRLEELNLIAS